MVCLWVSLCVCVSPHNRRGKALRILKLGTQACVCVSVYVCMMATVCEEASHYWISALLSLCYKLSVISPDSTPLIADNDTEAAATETLREIERKRERERNREKRERE